METIYIIWDTIEGEPLLPLDQYFDSAEKAQAYLFEEFGEDDVDALDEYEIREIIRKRGAVRKVRGGG